MPSVLSFVEKKGSKILSRMVGAMPGPLSATVNWIKSPACRLVSLFLRQHFFLKADLQDTAAFPQGMKGVGAEVHDRLVDLRRIGKNAADIR